MNSIVASPARFVAGRRVAAVRASPPLAAPASVLASEGLLAVARVEVEPAHVLYEQVPRNRRRHADAKHRCGAGKLQPTRHHMINQARKNNFTNDRAPPSHW